PDTPPHHAARVHAHYLPLTVRMCAYGPLVAKGERGEPLTHILIPGKAPTVSKDQDVRLRTLAYVCGLDKYTVHTRRRGDTAGACARDDTDTTRECVYGSVERAAESERLGMVKVMRALIANIAARAQEKMPQTTSALVRQGQAVLILLPKFARPRDDRTGELRAREDLEIVTDLLQIVMVVLTQTDKVAPGEL
ncbi:hypothetical protein SARC_14464, partial [Sphaeroforma arctica JP610]